MNKLSGIELSGIVIFWLLGVSWLVGIVLVILKLAGVMDWGWWLVTLPFWSTVVLEMIVLFMGGKDALDGISLLWLVGIVFVILKITGVIDWSWWLVTMPFWSIVVLEIVSLVGIFHLWLLGIVFVALKLTGTIDWSWWLVTLPFWGTVVLEVSLFGIIILGTVIASKLQKA